MAAALAIITDQRLLIEKLMHDVDAHMSNYQMAVRFLKDDFGHTIEWDGPHLIPTLRPVEPEGDEEENA